MIASPSFEERVNAVEEESARLSSVIADVLDKRVPSCPDWSARELAQHVAGVFTFWAHQLASADPTERRDPPGYESTAASDPVEWLDAATGVLVEALSELGPDEPCWNWSGADLDSGWVARRMALEVAVHRYDGELTAGDISPIGLALAAHTTLGMLPPPLAGTGGFPWVVEVGNGRLRTRHKPGPAAAVLRGSASELFLFSWNRVGLEDLELTGERSVAEAWSSLPV